MQDRLADLRSKRLNDVAAPSASGGPVVADKHVEIEMEDISKGDMDDCLRPYEDLRLSIATIEQNIESINELKQRSNKEVKDDAQREIMRDLDRVMLQSKREARQVKKTLDTLLSDNEAYEKKHPGSTSAQMRKNMLATHCRQFQDVMNEFQSSTQAFRQSLKERIARQARIVQDDITAEQIDELIESDNPGAIFQNAMMQMDDQLVDAVKDIEDQHKGMLKIEQGVREIQELFQDMAVLVDLQQETLDVIERNVQDTAKYTRDAEKNITQAEVYQKNSRKSQCYIILLLLIICAVIIFFLWK